MSDRLWQGKSSASLMEWTRAKSDPRLRTYSSVKSDR